ncbi:hypothetical protein Tco_0929928, partial [Tanacetum coccineum]
KGGDFMVFNRMAGLPRMGKARRKTQVATFFSIAKAVLATNGIIAVGDGKGDERMGKPL